MSKRAEGSTGQLLEFCSIYFLSYVVTGVCVKYFLGSPANGFPGMKEMEYLVYNTTGSVIWNLTIAVIFGWFRMHSSHHFRWWKFALPSELPYIVASGICTAVVIPTTTLMYSLPISVMVAMVIMRGAVIVISRAVDAIQIHQGILKRHVFWEENMAVVFAILAVAMNVLLRTESGAFDFIHNIAAMTILTSYIVAYSIRIYIMNYYKNTRAPGEKQDTKGFFFYEQTTATLAMFVVAFLLVFAPSLFGSSHPVELFRGAILEPKPKWSWAMISGIAYGSVAAVSVFIFMFKGRTATFAGLVNRLTSLVAGTAATLISYFLFNGKLPSHEEWMSLGCILIAVWFLGRAERRRVKELAAAGH